MRRHTALVLSLIAALCIPCICCCSSTPIEAEPLEGPDGPSTTTAGWEGSGDGRAPVVIYPDSGETTAPAVTQAPAVQPLNRPVPNDFVEENRRLRQRVESLSREVDGMRIRRETAAVQPAEDPMALNAGGAGAGISDGGTVVVPAPARAGISVEAVRAVLAESGAGQIQVALNPQNEVFLTLPGTISFGSGKADLRSSAQTIVARAVGGLKARYPGLRVRVEGHTDSDPIRKSNWPSNMALSKARADAVAAQLVRSTPLTPAEVQSRGFGESRPVASNTSKEGKAQNRRCEIVLLP